MIKLALQWMHAMMQKYRACMCCCHQGPMYVLHIIIIQAIRVQSTTRFIDMCWKLDKQKLISQCLYSIAFQMSSARHITQARFSQQKNYSYDIRSKFHPSQPSQSTTTTSSPSSYHDSGCPIGVTSFHQCIYDSKDSFILSSTIEVIHRKTKKAP